ncbi:hypothetical protein V8E53_009098 [Lactarius tabidus]
MTRFNTVKFDSNATGTFDAGSGVTLDQVYAILNSTGLNIIAGRIPSVGISGLTLVGGYSFMSNQYGLTIDNMAAYELVLPNGTITTVTESDEDLWFALRGEGNNFGMVTKFTYNLQDDTTGPNLDQQGLVKEALVNFQQTNDPKAALNISAIYTPMGALFAAFLFYNAPTPVPGIFDDFLAIPSNQSDVNTRSFLDLFSSLAYLNPSPTQRGLGTGISITQYSPSVFDTAVNQILVTTTFLPSGEVRSPPWTQGATVTIVLEPFLINVFSHGSDCAYPSNRSHALFPTSLLASFSNASLDDIVVKAVHDFSETVTAAAVADGQNLTHAAVYPNYVLFDTPLEDLYGANLPMLRAIKKAIDPENVMGLAGGFKIV